MNKLRYTDEELSIIKATFAENEPILKAIRKVFLQLPLKEQDENELRAFKGSNELNRVVRKTFLPELDGDAPLGQNIDLWMTISVAEKTAEDALPIIQARAIVIEYLEQCLASLKGDINVPVILLKDLLPKDGEVAKIFSHLIARNTIIQHTEMVLNQLNFLAGLKNETPEETKKRLMKDSNK